MVPLSALVPSMVEVVAFDRSENATLPGSVAAITDTHDYTHLYIAALALYVSDALAAIRGRNMVHLDNNEAINDFNGSQQILKHLCEQAGLEKDWIQPLIESRLCDQRRIRAR